MASAICSSQHPARSSNYHWPLDPPHFGHRPDQRLLDLLGIDLPIIQAPIAGLATSAMAASVAEVGGLGSLGYAVLSADQIRAELGAIRRQTSKPTNLNFSAVRR
jgi:NAD(P)H-dependent flavin oxidoreductase YrpB (nitropropane dioxygenase family)